MKDFFEGLPPGTVFRRGTLPNSPEGLFMTDAGGMLQWLAKKGWANDWAIYCHWEWRSADYVEKNGDKVKSKANILKCMPDCEDILNLYRY